MNDIAKFLGIDPRLYPRSAFAAAHNQFSISRGWFARRLLRSRAIRRWSRRLAPKAVRQIARSLLYVKGAKPALDEKTRLWLQEYFAQDLKRLEKLLGYELEALRDG